MPRKEQTNISPDHEIQSLEAMIQQLDSEI